MLSPGCKGASLCSRRSSAAHTTTTSLSDNKPATTNARMAPPPPPRSIGFSLQAFKRYPEIIPLVSILGAAMVGLSVWSGYALLTKSDVKLRRSELSRWDTIQVDQPQKLLTINQRYGEDPAITTLKREIAEAYKGQ